MPLALGAAALSWTIGDMLLTVETIGGATPPSPSPADAFYLLFYPLAYLALMLFIKRDFTDLSSASWLDGLIAGLGSAALCSGFAFHGILHATNGRVLATATNMAYPVGDVLLLGFVLGGSAIFSGRRRSSWVLLGLGITLNVAGDTANLFQSTLGSTHVGSLFNSIAWPTAILCMSAAVWLRPRQFTLLSPDKVEGFLLPGLASAAALAILLIAAVRPVGHITVALGVLTLLLAGFRLALSSRSLRRLTAERHRQSISDELTGLGNRRQLFSILDAFFQQHTERAASLAFLFIDLDHFKEINDSFGHPSGDALLRELGPRLNGVVRRTDLVARIGGDEFVILLMDAQAAYAEDIARRVTGVLAEPFSLDAVQVQIGASIGIALAPSDALDSTSLIWCADAAMYRAKLSQTPYALYNEIIDGAGVQLHLVDELSHAVERKQFALHYQPQLDLRTGRISSVEALLRWPHPKLGLIPPPKFLPLAEEANLMRPLTTWVIDEAMAQCRRWRNDGQTVAVSVNVSLSNLLDDGFVELVERLLRAHDLPGHALVLEITETSILAEFERISSVVQQLHGLDVMSSIDDFGSGFTSLAHLSSLAVDELKLDRSFITGISSTRGHQDLVRATIDLGHALNLRVVAEGVEDESMLATLKELGCDMAQGYFIGRPMPSDRLFFRSASPMLEVPSSSAIA